MTTDPFADLIVPPSAPPPALPRPEPEPGTPLADAFAAAHATLADVPHEDWCCAKGCAGPGFCGGCAGGEDDCTCAKREIVGWALNVVEALDAASLLRDGRTWAPADGDARCQACGRENPVWFAPSPVWNRVVGSRYGVLCPTCFLQRARMVLDDPVFRIDEEVPSGE